jgi:tetratricopeptide (TPR) repeat protein
VKSNVRLAVALAALVALAIALQMMRDRRYAQPGETADAVLYVRSPEAMRRLALSFTALAADLDWIRAVQHYGGDHGAPQSGTPKYQLLYPLLDRTTTLDPRFNIAYRFGAIFLAEGYPLGVGRPDLAIALLRKGIAAQPQRWEYLEDIGFVYYWQLHDYKSAAEWFDRGGQIAGAPWWLRTMAAVMLTRGGDRASSRLLWRQLHESADNDWLRGQAELRLAQLDAMDQIDQLQVIIGRYHTLTGRVPDSWLAVERAHLLRGTPLDPSGTPYVLDPDFGRVSVSPSSKLHPLPIEPPGAVVRS